MYFQAAKLLLFYEISKKKLKNIQKKNVCAAILCVSVSPVVAVLTI